MSWTLLAVMVIISLLIVNKLKCSNLMMIPIVIVEFILYWTIVLVFKMIVPLFIIAVILAVIYFSQPYWNSEK